MEIRPQDLPEIRAEIRAQLVHPTLVRALAEKSGDSIEEAQGLASDLQEAMDELTLFHVSAPMTELAAAAANSLEVFLPTYDDMPAQGGLIVYEGEPSKALTFEDGCRAPLRGIIWGSDDRGESMFLLPVVAVHHGVPVMGRLIAYLDTVALLDLGVEQQRSWTGPELGGDDVLGLLLTTWLLMQQPLAEASEVEADRAARKRLRRIGHEPAPVRVIELRRPKHSSGEPGESGRNYTHRWITRGHWRQQWYPARQVHRPVWIAPHVKGPEGAPMIGGEKVYAWKR